MRRNFPYRVFAMSIVFVTSSVLVNYAGAAQAEQGILSIEETIKLAQMQFEDHPPPKSYHDQMLSGNKLARPELYKLLNDPTQQHAWANIIISIGYFGDGNDCDKLVALATRMSGTMTPEDISVVISIPQALCNIRKRTGVNIDSNIDKLVDVKAWTTKGIAGVNGDFGGEIWIPMRTIIELKRLNESRVPALARNLRDSVKDQYQRDKLDKWFAYYKIIPAE